MFFYEKGLSRLLNHIKYENHEVRVLSMRILLLLLYNNQTLQNIFCEKFNFSPVGKVVCLNWFPKELKNSIKIDDVVLKDIKFLSTKVMKNKKFWMWPYNEAKNEDNFPDPQVYLIGFYIEDKFVISL